MILIKVSQTNEAAHACCFFNNNIKNIPEGWAVIPDDMETPNLPYGDITVEDIPKTEIETNEEGEEVEVIVGYIPTVTSWTPREMPTFPEVEETETEPTADELIDILLGVNENE